MQITSAGIATPTSRPAPAGHSTAAPARIPLLALICGLALLLRLWVGFSVHYLIHPDETYDYLEQGFRLAYGFGAQVWTYQDGVRSYVFPAILAAVIRLGASIGQPPADYLDAVALVMSVLSLSVVAAAFVWGERSAGLLGAIITASVAATWFELIYFAPHPLSEVMSANFLVVAACLCPAAKAASPSSLRCAGLGLCLGMAFVFRIQLAPAILIIAIWLLWHHGWQNTLRVAIAASIPVIATGLLDWITYRYPFQSFWLNFYANTFAGVATYYGTEPFYHLADLEIHYQGAWFFLIVTACAVAGRRQPLLLAIATVIALTHSLIGHQEYRFIYPALPFVFVLAGLATTELVTRLVPPTHYRGRYVLGGFLIMLWGLASWAQATEGPFRREWFRSRGELSAARFIATLPGVCGIAGYRSPAALPGKVQLNQDVPVYSLTRSDHFAQYTASFNVVIAGDDSLPAGNVFTLRKCWANGFNEASYNRRMPSVCVLTRPGMCVPGALSDPDGGRPPGW